MYLFIDLLIWSTSLLCLNLYVVNFLVYLSYYCVKIHNLHNTVHCTTTQPHKFGSTLSTWTLWHCSILAKSSYSSIGWNYPAPRMIVTTRSIPFLVWESQTKPSFVTRLHPGWWVYQVYWKYKLSRDLQVVALTTHMRLVIPQRRRKKVVDTGWTYKGSNEWPRSLPEKWGCKHGAVGFFAILHHSCGDQFVLSHLNKKYWKKDYNMYIYIYIYHLPRLFLIWNRIQCL